MDIKFIIKKILFAFVLFNLSLYLSFATKSPTMVYLSFIINYILVITLINKKDVIKSIYNTLIDYINFDSNIKDKIRILYKINRKFNIQGIISEKILNDMDYSNVEKIVSIVVDNKEREGIELVEKLYKKDLNNVAQYMKHVIRNNYYLGLSFIYTLALNFNKTFSFGFVILLFIIMFSINESVYFMLRKYNLKLFVERDIVLSFVKNIYSKNSPLFTVYNIQLLYDYIIDMNFIDRNIKEISIQSSRKANELPSDIVIFK